eukprot:13549364-Heterocapsa_arctica.AAC.1
MEQFGIGELFPKMQQLGFGTMGDFAFSSAYVPGAANEEPFLRVIERITNTQDPIGKPAFRRLFYEA